MKKDKITGKHVCASLPFKAALFIFLAVAVFLFVGGKTKGLIVSHQETGEVFISVPVQTGDTLTFRWIHSFEHIPWEEKYQILENNHLLLQEIQVAGFGAGIPENKGTVTVKNGLVVMSEIDEEFEGIYWIHSNTALQLIAVNGETVLEGMDLPHHESIELNVKGRLSEWRNLH